MRWFVDVTAIGKTEAQKYCVDAESWQRALQAARAQRGEEGPMSGFSIELLEEGYRAIDPVARVRFVVKRAPDDAPITTSAKDAKSGLAPASLKPAASAAAGASAPPRPPPPVPVAVSTAPASSPPPSKKSSPPRPGPMTNGPASTKGGIPPNPVPADLAPAPAKQLLAVGTSTPGLPLVKLLTSREQNPSEQSPLTYREYAFSVPAGTSDELAADVLRAQLKIIDAHIGEAKMGKLVNLAVFDVEFSGKPPAPPLATLTWKDWKGDPVVGFPKRGAAQKQVKPPSAAPAAPEQPASQIFPPPPSVMPQSALLAQQHLQSAAAAPAPTPPSVPPPGSIPPPPAAVLAASAPPQPITASMPAAPPAAAIPNPFLQAPVSVIHPSNPPSAKGPSEPPPASTTKRQSSFPPPGDGMVRTPSGRFVRGRVTGDELITALFESMHDLHFLRDALDGGQFCLALATEVLPARIALIHFFDIERREWVVACTRGKDSNKLLTMRTTETDELLRDAARKRRAVVLPNGTDAVTDRYQSIGGSRSMIIAPIMQAGRALGAIEIINPLDGMPFTEDEGNAMTYIAEQYAEYLGSRGIVLDRDRIQSAASAR